jgi:hypothetical protein
MKIPITVKTIGPSDFKPVYRKEYIIGCDIEKQKLTYSYKDGEMYSSFDNFNQQRPLIGHLSDEEIEKMNK